MTSHVLLSAILPFTLLFHLISSPVCRFYLCNSFISTSILVLELLFSTIHLLLGFIIVLKEFLLFFFVLNFEFGIYFLNFLLQAGFLIVV